MTATSKDTRKDWKRGQNHEEAISQIPWRIDLRDRPGWSGANGDGNINVKENSIERREEGMAAKVFKFSTVAHAEKAN